jgi:serine/threonine-protein kinase
MTPELHQRVRKLFEEALELPEGGRRAYLEIACAGDDEVFQAALRLLEASKPAQSFMETKPRGMERIGRYLVAEELGRGGMGVVYAAVDPLIGRNLAIKVIHAEALGDPSEAQFLRERLFREARSAGQLFHPGIVTVLDVGQEGELAFIAMERVDGLSLQKHLASGQKLNQAQILAILRQTAAALDFAYRSKIVHCDVKPGNIILDQSGMVKLTDFGIAKITSTQYQTRSGLLMGTPSYMSPEQIEGRALDGRSDQFSLAVVAFELLTGAVPFKADSLAGLAHSIVYGTRPSARTANPQLPASADLILERALAKSVDDRFPNCAQFVRELELSLSGVPQPPPAIAPERPLSPPPVPVTVSAPVAAAVPPVPVQTSQIQSSQGQNNPAQTNPTRTWAIAIAAVLLLALAGVGVYQFKMRAPTAPASGPVASTASTSPPNPASTPASGPESAVSNVAPPSATSAPSAGPVSATPSSPVSPAQQPVSPPPTSQPALIAPVVARFTADPASLPAGATATLEWEVKGAVKVIIDPEVGEVKPNDTAKVKPRATTVYKLTAIGLGGQITQQALVTVTPGPSPETLYTQAMTERKAGRRDKAAALFRQAADLGEARAMLELGKMSAEEGPGQDYGEATRWFRAAAEKGNSQSMLLLGTMYYLAKGVTQDYAAAANWFQKASDAGERDAKYDLGTMYESGLGVPKDAGKAKQLYQDAAKLGNDAAKKRLDSANH